MHMVLSATIIHFAKVCLVNAVSWGFYHFNESSNIFPVFFTFMSFSHLCTSVQSPDTSLRQSLTAAHSCRGVWSCGAVLVGWAGVRRNVSLHLMATRIRSTRKKEWSWDQWHWFSRHFTISCPGFCSVMPAPLTQPGPLDPSVPLRWGIMSTSWPPPPSAWPAGLCVKCLLASPASLVQEQRGDASVWGTAQMMHKCHFLSYYLCILWVLLVRFECSLLLTFCRGVQPFGISGPYWKKSCLWPHIKYTNTNENWWAKKKGFK